MNKLTAFFLGRKAPDNNQVTAEEIENGSPFEETSSERAYRLRELRAVQELMPAPSNVEEEYLRNALEEHGLDPARYFESIAEFPNRQMQTQAPFIWESNDGKMNAVTKMATPHLFNILRMLFNHSVPPAFRVGPFTRRENVDKWPLDYKMQAGTAIVNELCERTDFELCMQLEIKDMKQNAEFLDQVTRDDSVVKLEPREAIQSMLAGAPPFDVGKLMKSVKRVRRAKKKIVQLPAFIQSHRVRGYTRANGNKVRGYYR